MLFGLLAVPAAASSSAFDDVPGDALYAGSVASVTARGLMTGTSETGFSPDKPVTRAMAVTAVYRLAGEPEIEEKSPFTDVEAGSWYESAVSWGWKNGIVRGVSESLFMPDAPCSVQESAVFFHRYARLAGLDAGVPENIPASDGVKLWAAEAVSWASAKGLLDESAGVTGTVTRGFFAVMLCIFSPEQEPASDEAPIPGADTDDGASYYVDYPAAPPSVGTQQLTYGAAYRIEAPSGFLTSISGSVMIQDAGSASTWVLQNAGSNRFRLRDLRSWQVLTLGENGITTEQFTGGQDQSLAIEAANGGFTIRSDAGLKLVLDGTEIWTLAETSSGTALDFKRHGTQYIGIRSYSVSDGNVIETTGYYPIRTSVELPDAGYSLSGGENYSIGLKVMYVNRFLYNAGYLSSDYMNYSRYDANTTAAVQQFQTDIGLYADGIVDQGTWAAMGYSDDDWHHLGGYVMASKVPAYGSDRETYIKAMVDTAKEYEQCGTSYAEGVASMPGSYVSDGGLVLQCLYAAGVCPDVTIIDHACSAYGNLSGELGNDGRLGTAVENAQPGDLIFYGGREPDHAAICVGDGLICDSHPGQGVAIRSIYAPGNILKIIRVF